MLSSRERNGIAGTAAVVLLCLVLLFAARGCGGGERHDYSAVIDTLGHHQQAATGMRDADDAAQTVTRADSVTAAEKTGNRAGGKDKKKGKRGRKGGTGSSKKSKQTRPARVPLDEII